MPESDQPMLITKRIAHEDVSWGAVLDSMRRTFRLDVEQATGAVKQFSREFTKPLNLHWFLRSQLSTLDNKIAAALCNVNGADTVELTYAREISFGLFSVPYEQVTTFRPALKEERSGSASTTIQLSVFGRKRTVNSLAQALGIQALIFLIGVALYVLVMGLVLYSIAVTIKLMQAPAHTARYLFNEPAALLAFTCFLMGCAMLCGRAVRNVTGVLYSKLLALFRRTKARQPS